MSGNVLITGCSSGIGQASARAFHAAGWRVMASARSLDALADLGCAARIKLDVTDANDIAAATALIESGFSGRLDALVNNAGASLISPFEETPEASGRRVMEVNYFGAVAVTRALLPALRRARGRVVNVSSMTTYFPMPMNSFYVASKAALEGWSDSLSHELAEHGVAVSLVQPGPVKTRFADNMELHQAKAGGPYEAQMAEFLEARQQLIARGGAAPESVARAILDVAQAAHPPMRVRVGGAAKAAWAASRMAPSGLYAAMVRKAVKPKRGP